MIRATTGGVMKTYRSNLMNSFINMNASRNTVLTQRTFNSFAEDPAAAAKAFRLRKSRMMVESQYAICTDTKGKYQQAVSCLQSIDDVLCTKDGVYGQYMTTLTGTTLSMLNDPSGDAREQLIVALDQMSQQIVQTMNQKYGDNFIFAGADGHNVPFEIRENVLYYRGVPVDAALPNVLSDKDGFVLVDKDGNLVDRDNPPAEVYYLRMEPSNVKTISEKEYEDLYIEPKLRTFEALQDWDTENDDNDDPIMYAFNSLGEPIRVKKEEIDGETVYSFDYDSDEKERHPNDEFITLSEDSIYYKLQSDDGDELFINMKDCKDSPPNLTDTIEYDSLGRIKVGGGYYDRIYYNTDGSIKRISKQEFEDAQARAADDDNKPKLLKDDADGDGIYDVVSVNEDGTRNDEGGGYYRIIDESQLITPSEYEEQKLIADKLNYLAQETQFVDIGFGFQEDPVTGKLIETSAFNAALNGINFLGYGLDEDGDPRNIYSLVQRMQKVSNSVDSGTDWDDDTWSEFNRLVGKFESAVSKYQTEFVNLDASTSKLNSQQELLVDNFDNLQEQYSDIEDVDMVDAITSFIWAEYCYNAALKVGNSILSESLMDYLR